MKNPALWQGRGGSGVTGSKTPTPTSNAARPASPLFGPWSPDVPPGERIAQLRSLAALAAVFLGSGHQLVVELRAAETDDKAAQRAFELIDYVLTLTRRRMLSAFSSVTWRGRT
jgi:hypothetical protein